MRALALVTPFLGVAVLLTGCEQGPAAAGCDIDVDSSALVSMREDADIADCDQIPTVAGDDVGADLPDLALDCLGGTDGVSLSDVQGPALINFWASNCGPCRDEMPALQRFEQTYGDQVPVIGVDFLDTYPEAALSLADASGVRYPSLADPCGGLQETDLVVQALPQFLVVAEDGSVEQVAGGVDSLADVVALVEKNLDLRLTGTSR